MGEAFDFKLWIDFCFPWRNCPKCRMGIEQDKLVKQEHRRPGVLDAIHRGLISPDEDGGPYAATYVCQKCETPLAVAGEWSVGPEWDGDGHQYWETLYRPRWISQCPELVEAPGGVPRSIVDALRRADPLFWADLNACATALRQVVEVFLDEQGVERQEKKADGTTGGFRPIEKRIEMFVEAVEGVSEGAADEYETLLRATKFKGNDATHDVGELKVSDICTLARMVKRVLEMRYPQRDDLLAEAVKIIGSRHSKRQRKQVNGSQGTPQGTGED